LIELQGREVGGVGVEEVEAGGVVDGVPGVERLRGEAGEVVVELDVAIGFGEWHVGGDAALCRGVPDGVVGVEGRLVPVEVAGEGGLRCAGVAADELEDEQIVFEAGGRDEPVAFFGCDVGVVGFGFALEGFAGFAEFVVLVDALDELLEADGDDEADDDGRDVDEEVAPGVGGGVGWVDVEHKKECMRVEGRV
jgi:hypothetical protein